MMLNRIKWLIAPKEMAELERWRIQWTEHRRWFAEFPVAELVLEHLRAEVKGEPVTTIHAVRNGLRAAIAEMAQQKEGE